MRTNLTAMAIEKIPHPESGQVRYWDTVVPGFGVRVTAQSKTFFVSFGKERKSKTLGKYPALSLKMARDAAKKFQATRNPNQVNTSVSEARDAFLADVRARLRPSTVDQYERYIQTDIKLLSDVKRSSIDTNHSHTVASWKAFMNWCVKEELIDRNPFIGTSAKNGTRDRVLSDDEIRAVWSYDFEPFSNIVKMLLITGLRRTEVTNIKLIGDHFVLAPDDTKNNKGHTIPATEWARQYLTFQKFNGWSKAKARMDEHIILPHWTLHDLRRTYATIHARIGTPLHVIEALLNHQSGEISGLKAIYIRHNFLKEAAEAVANYEKELHSIVS